MEKEKEEGTITGEKCLIHTTFSLRNEIINVVKDHSNDRQTDAFTNSGKKIRTVVLGEKDHFEALYSRIDELKLDIEHYSRLHCSRKVAKYQEELEQRQREITFLSSCNLPKVDDTSTDADSATDSTDDTEDTYLEANADQVISVARDTFGEIRQLKVIEMPKSDELFSRPWIRQYFIGPVLHRPSEHMKVEWIELFYDLIYVGGFSKAGHLMYKGFNWEAFLKFYLTFIPLLFRWRADSSLTNQVHDESIIRKIFGVISIAVIVIMTVSIDHAFDKSADTNTLGYYLGFHLVGALLNQLYFIYAVLRADKSFLVRELVKAAVTSVSLIPYVILLACFPIDGTYGRNTTRLIVFCIGTIMEAFIFPIFIALTQKSILMDRRLAVNIEHIAERYGLLIVIVLGEIIFGFLDSFDNSKPVMTLVNMVWGLLNAICLFYSYFRAELENHYKHALRRHWFSGVCWTFLHIPIAVTIVSVASCLSNLLSIASADIISGTSKPVSYEFQTILGTSYAVHYLCLGFLGFMHQQHPKKKRAPNSKRKIANIPRMVILGIRFAIGLVFLVLGLTVSITAQAWLAISTVFTVFAVFIEEYGRIRGRKCPDANPA